MAVRWQVGALHAAPRSRSGADKGTRRSPGLKYRARSPCGGPQVSRGDFYMDYGRNRCSTRYCPAAPAGVPIINCDHGGVECVNRLLWSWYERARFIWLPNACLMPLSGPFTAREVSESSAAYVDQCGPMLTPYSLDSGDGSGLLRNHSGCNER